jgi:putative ABC transport system permease protein
MLSLQRTLSLGYLGRHRTRTALVVASIALGVAALVATRSLNQCLGKAAQAATNPLSNLADLLVVNGQLGVSRDLADRMAEAGVPGVHALQPLVIGRVAVADLDNRSVPLFGIDVTADEVSPGRAGSTRPIDLGVELKWTAGLTDLFGLYRAGRWPALVGIGLADDLPDRNAFRVLCAGKEQQLAGIGTVRLQGPAALLGNNVLFMNLADAAALVYPERPGYVSQINVTLEPGADAVKVRQQLQEVVGDLGEVRTVEANDQTYRDVTAGLELGFAIGGVGALVTGLFLVYNALAVSVAERRHDIGILRSVGATRRQVAGLFVGEAAVLGLAGSLLGVPAGFGLAWALLGPLRDVLSDLFVPLENVSLDLWTLASIVLMAVALAAGVMTAVLAALIPAWTAASEEPADAVRRVPVAARLLGYLLQIVACGSIMGVGLGFVLLRDRLPPRAGTFGGIAFLFVGALAATPLFTAALARLIQPLFRRLLGLEGRLAADNLVRTPGRTGLVIGALAATGALMVQTAGFIQSSKAVLLEWIDDSIAADLFVTSGSSVTSGGLALPMDERIGKELAALPGVDAALAIRFHRLDYRNRIVILIALDSRAFHGAAHDHALARNLSRFPRLREPGTAIVSENFASLYGVAVGDHIEIPGRSGKLRLEVIGTSVDYTWNRGTILVDRDWFRGEFADNQVDIYDVYLRPGADREAMRQLIAQRWGKKEAVFVADRDEVRRELSSALDRVYGLAYVQQSVSALVAMLGVASALIISVLQRRRELGLLRAVGASRSQVLRTVLAEATLMGLIGAAIGLLVGVALEWYVLQVLIRDEAGFVFALRVPWLPAGVVFGASVVLATLVGLWPAYQATRLRIPEAIAYE